MSPISTAYWAKTQVSNLGSMVNPISDHRVRVAVTQNQARQDAVARANALKLKSPGWDGGVPCRDWLDGNHAVVV